MAGIRVFPDHALTLRERSLRWRQRQKGLLPPVPPRPERPDCGLPTLDELIERVKAAREASEGLPKFREGA